MTDASESTIPAAARRAEGLAGLATFGAACTGVISLFAAFVAFLGSNGQAMGMCLIAAAIAFGGLANALTRA
jgi:hypothetical protein